MHLSKLSPRGRGGGGGRSGYLRGFDCEVRPHKPQVLAPLGTSDHNSVRWLPRVNLRSKNHTQGPAKRPVHLYPRHAVNAFGRWSLPITGLVVWIYLINLWTSLVALSRQI